MTKSPVPFSSGERTGERAGDGLRAPVERGEADDTGRALDRRVRAVVEGMSDAFLALDADWRVTYANREAARLNATTPEALVGVDHWQRWPETVGGEVEREYRRAMRDRVAVRLEHYYPAAARWHEIRAFPTDDGGLAIFYRDVTAQKHLEAERSRQARELAAAHEQALAAELQFRLMVDRVRDYAVFLMDPDGVVTHWGEGAHRMKGWGASEAIGMHVSRFYPPGGVAEDGSVADHLRVAAETGEWIGEGTRIRRGSHPFPARVTITALRRAGTLVGFSCITQDLTAEREREEAIVAALTAAQGASDAKSQFLANTSHEIRTPLNAIMGYAELLAMELAGPLAPGQRQYVERVQETSRHLLSLVNDVLDLSRVEAGHLRTVSEPGFIADVAEAALRVIEPQARARRVALANACSAAPRVAYLGDSERVRQILVNLLSNATRFTPAEGRVTISCGVSAEAPEDAAVARGGPWAYVRVEDTGPGIAPADRQRMWDAFVQLDGGHTRTVGGSGLGLTISRHLARLMGGDITVRSEERIGSSFALWLRAADPASVVTLSPAATGVASARAPVEEMPRSEDSLAVAIATMREHATGMADIGEALIGESERILAKYVARLRTDEQIPSARGLPDEALADHEVTFLADVAQCLSVAALDGPEATAMLTDATAIQRLIATRHGVQRARLGWSEDEVRRDYEILLEEVLAAVRRRVARSSTPSVSRAAELITILVRVAERHSLQAMMTGRGSAPPQTETPRDE